MLIEDIMGLSAIQLAPIVTVIAIMVQVRVCPLFIISIHDAVVIVDLVTVVRILTTATNKSIRDL